MKGEWYVSDGKIYIDEGEYFYHLDVTTENGITYIDRSGFGFMRVEDRNALLDDMFVFVDLTAENVADYCGIAIRTEEETDSFGEYTGDTNTRVILTSKVYDQGLMYFDCSDDLAVEVIVPAHKYTYITSWGTRVYENEEESFTVTYSLYGYYGHSVGYKWESSESIPDLKAENITFGRVQGSIIFINAEYVDDVKLNNGTRYLVIGDQEHYQGSYHEGYDY